MVTIAIGVPLLLAALFVVLYATGVLRDEQRADYCAVWAPLSAELASFDVLADDLEAADPTVVLTSVMQVRELVNQMTAQPSTSAIEAELEAMTEYLRSVELAARRHDSASLTELAGQFDTSFTTHRQEFLRLSAEYCRYR
jgi:hypothetical protein